MVMLVYDVTNEQSFQKLGAWLDLVRKRCPDKVLPGVVVANKIDLEERARVGAADGDEFARANTLEFFQVSAARNTHGACPSPPPASSGAGASRADTWADSETYGDQWMHPFSSSLRCLHGLMRKSSTA